MNATESVPGFKEAMRLTTHTIETRTARFRNTVIAIVVVGLISMASAGVLMSWLPLLGFLLLVPLCGTFLYLDMRLVSDWQKRILEMWLQESLDLGIFSNAMVTIRSLPSHTLHGMLRVRVTPRVQTVDFGRSTTRDGQFVPAIVTRQTNRVVDLQPGQSFAITGVLNDEVVRQLQKVPELGNQRLMQALLSARTRRPMVAKT